ncbi:unnamed protein product [Gongylonema pulchrum]|uniref:G_PROTEIN_RECEP_F1_2 domain-containing protein n=1 Tax=Gongylonema pulchrum TaxID=637853 RepID=A0A3P7PGB5_9BILA|nr:unnamed protein product [Gongylonema pulchrum]
MRSLRVVAACVGLGWLMTMVVNLMTFIPDISDLAMFYTAAYAGIFVNVSIACNWFIYYFRSADYRYEFKKQLQKLPCVRNVVKPSNDTIKQISEVITVKF